MNDKEKMELLNPAFPTETDNGYWHGMTLRDYFAAKALQGLVSFGSAQMRADEAADFAYRMADAMLAAREQSEPQAE